MELKNETNFDEKIIKDHPTKIVLSYALAGFGINALYGMILTNTFYFYENFSGLSIATVGLAYIIFTIWDAINDPLLGILSDKPTKISRKWGRRFPWIMGSIIPMIILAGLIYRPPTGVPWQTFAYMLVVLIGYEVFFTLVGSIVFYYFNWFPYEFQSKFLRIIDCSRRKDILGY